MSAITTKDWAEIRKTVNGMIMQDLENLARHGHISDREEEIGEHITSDLLDLVEQELVKRMMLCLAPVEAGGVS